MCAYVGLGHERGRSHSIVIPLLTTVLKTSVAPSYDHSDLCPGPLNVSDYFRPLINIHTLVLLSDRISGVTTAPGIERS